MLDKCNDAYHGDTRVTAPGSGPPEFGILARGLLPAGVGLAPAVGVARSLLVLMHGCGGRLARLPQLAQDVAHAVGAALPAHHRHAFINAFHLASPPAVYGAFLSDLGGGGDSGSGSGSCVAGSKQTEAEAREEERAANAP